MLIYVLFISQLLVGNQIIMILCLRIEYQACVCVCVCVLQAGWGGGLVRGRDG